MNKEKQLIDDLLSEVGFPYKFDSFFDRESLYDYSIGKLYLLNKKLGKVVMMDSFYESGDISKYFYFEQYNLYVEIAGTRYDGDEEVSWDDEYYFCRPRYQIDIVYERNRS